MKIINQLIVSLSLASVFVVTSCKPKTDIEKDGTIKKEQLGNIVLDNNISLNFEGQPMGFVKIGKERQAYEWRPSTKTWEKLGDLIKSEHVIAPDLVEDDQNNYFMLKENYVFQLNHSTNTWDTLTAFNNNNQPPNGTTALLSNTNGDIYILKNENVTKAYNLFKKSGTSNWVVLNNLPSKFLEWGVKPVFLSSKGYLYFESNYHIIPEVYNIYKETADIFFDKTDQVNFPILTQYAFKGIYIFNYFMQPDGTMFVAFNDQKANEYVIYKFGADKFPVQSVKVQSYPINLLGHEKGWTTSLTIPNVTPEGDLKTYIICDGNNEGHRAEVIGKIGSNQELKVYGHPVYKFRLDELKFSKMNARGDVFIKPGENGYIFRW